MTIEFREWPKIPRWNRDLIITEKIDGTNAAVGIQKIGEVESMYDQENFPPVDPQATINVATLIDNGPRCAIYTVYAQSRSRIITPGQDNHGFAAWVRDNALGLYHTLGEGVHFGEWWGQGIQRRYGLDEKRFSLFNTDRHGGKNFSGVPGLGTVPVLYHGTLDGLGVVGQVGIDGAPSTPPWERCLAYLRAEGSAAAPGFDRPEGIVIFHVAANKCFKMTLEKDEVPKEVAAKRAAKLEQNPAA